MKRCVAFLIVIMLVFSNTANIYACNENQVNTYVCEILFGNNALVNKSDEHTKMLLAALYLCCEQSNNQGNDKLLYLKSKRVGKVPSLASINVKGTQLLKSSHIGWDQTYSQNTSVRENRKKILQNTVNKVFDFGVINNMFGSASGKCNSFSALLYYTHILSDYLADDSEETEVSLKSKAVPAFSGQAYTDVNGGMPSFTSSLKEQTTSFTSFSSLDSFGRCGVAFAVLGPDTLSSSDTRENITGIKPSGWNQNKYPDIVNSQPPYLYNRCHLIGHQLAGYDKENNLITGTRYLNETGMKLFEDQVSKHIKETGNHVLYRVTPVYKGDNLIASGVQIEAYSVEDEGALSFNVYCYNVQPGVSINYESGTNELADTMYGAKDILPFAVNNPSESNPDLMFEMNKHLEVLFGDKTGVSSQNYTAMMNSLNSIASNARDLGKINEKPALAYIKLKQCEYQYYETLKMYVPLLLKEEKFFKSVYANKVA